LSCGLSGNYRKFLAKRVVGYIGIGYYQLNIHKIRGPLPFNIPGERTARNIRFDDGMTNLLYGTTKYRYNNVAASIGAGYVVPVSSNWSIEAGPELVTYYSFSQRYRLGDATMIAPEYWRTRQRKEVEYGVNFNVGFYREYSGFYIRPALVVPVFQNLKGDAAFFEDGEMNISNWFPGIGLKVTVGKRMK
jgi:hypothetical protein